MRGRGRQPLRRWVPPLLRPAVLLVVAAFAAWEGVQSRFSTASHASILAAVGVALVLALASGRGRQRVRSRTWVRNAVRALGSVFAAGRLRTATVSGTLVWVLLIAATIGWDATSFTKQRHDLPTLSRLFGDLTGHHWGRGLLFAAWLVLGLYLATGWRRPSGVPSGGTGRPAGRTSGGAGGPTPRSPEEEGRP